MPLWSSPTSTAWAVSGDGTSLSPPISLFFVPMERSQNTARLKEVQHAVTIEDGAAYASAHTGILTAFSAFAQN